MKSICPNTLLFALCLIAAPAFYCGATSLPPETLELVTQRTDEIAPELIEIRRDLHMHPELAGEEVRTAEKIAEKLNALGLEVRTGVGGHGVVGVLRGGQAGPVVAYRADMDAFRAPGILKTDYNSQVPGVDHICGHDAHVAVGLGIADVLSSMKEDLAGTVVFYFQPAEENITGAKAMLADGALDDPRPEVIFAIHTAPAPSGSIMLPIESGLTGARPFVVRIEGESIPTSAGPAVLAALNSVSTVKMTPSPEFMRGLFADTVNPDSPYKKFVWVTITGPGDEPGSFKASVRASDDATYEEAFGTIEGKMAEISEEIGLPISVGREAEYLPDMHNPEALALSAKPALVAVFGAENVLESRVSIPFFGEDFSYFQAEIPGAMFFLGMANPEKGFDALNHMPGYDIDESAIALGVKGLSAVVLDYLESHAVEPENR